MEEQGESNQCARICGKVLVHGLAALLGGANAGPAGIGTAVKINVAARSAKGSKLRVQANT